MTVSLPPWVADWWRPIGTAPKDGTHVILGTFPGEVVTVGHWWSHDGEWALSVNFDGQHSNHGVSKPTHWMPMPPPRL